MTPEQQDLFIEQQDLLTTPYIDGALSNPPMPHPPAPAPAPTGTARTPSPPAPAPVLAEYACSKCGYRGGFIKGRTPPTCNGGGKHDRIAMTPAEKARI